jgi:hedgehog protein
MSTESPHAKSGGCFTGESRVLTSSGVYKKLSDISIGEQVLTIDPISGLPQFSEVLLFLDRDPNERRTFMQITTLTGRKLTVTPSHLLLVEQDNLDVKPIFAGKIKEGQKLLVLPEGADAVIWDFVIKVDIKMEKGVFAPLTSTGTIIVDDVAVSCYAVINSHIIAHLVFSPIRLFNNLRHSALAFWQGMRLIGYNSNSIQTVLNSNNEKPIGIHWYAKILYSIARYTLPSFLLYND